ncbi:LRR receptor-like serine/threonine-protein kinase FLS2 [Bidens hawaiensis]|uniref:LRR receptor-like serine/threonine-protein kinase FLS2 n=1 Tax=Bidens hawaiensis TaxID=980011 RepID=UPI0040492C61
MKTLAKLRHRNLVKVVGYAWESRKLKAVVLEYMENGNLVMVIHDSGIDRSKWNLSERVNMLVSISKGLVYLHFGYDFPIVHCDLKPSNILLNEKWDAHVSDFGTARILGVHQQDGGNVSSASAFQGTIGYLAPEFAYMRKVTTKVDVFSFGIILMEFMTGKRPTGLTEDDGTLPQLIEHALSKGIDELIEIVDPVLASDIPTKHGVIKQILQLALSCTRADPDDRPDMNEILSSLTKISKKM